MTILDDYSPSEITFIHIPRTGGRSICEAMGIERSHEPWQRRELKGYSFSVVRNPWEQVRSWYVSAEIAKPGSLWPGSPGFAFEEWCTEGFPVGDAAPYHDDHDLELPWWMMCHHFKQVERCGPNLDDIFRLEDRKRWWPTLCDKPMPHIGGGLGEKPKYTECAARRVEEFAANTIEEFHYLRPEEVRL